MSMSDSVGERGLPRTLWVVAALVVFAAAAGELLVGAALPPVDIVVTMSCLTVLRLLGAGLPMTCTVPFATASTLMPPGRSHRQEEEEP